MNETGKKRTNMYRAAVKKFLAMLLAVCVMMTFMPLNVFAENEDDPDAAAVEIANEDMSSFAVEGDNTASEENEDVSDAAAVDIVNEDASSLIVEAADDTWAAYAAESFSDSSEGTKEDPIEIGSAEELAHLANLANTPLDNQAHNETCEKYYKLTSDIDLSEHRWIPIGYDESGSYNYYVFQGYFDGGNHTIRGMRVEETSALCYGGLFGNISDQGDESQNVIIKDLTIEDAEVTCTYTDPDPETAAEKEVYGGGYVGILFGYFGSLSNDPEKKSIENIHVSGTVNGKKAADITTEEAVLTGGMIGYVMHLTINNCTADNIEITNETYGSSGGLIGLGSSVNINDCHVNGVSVEGHCRIGGLAGCIYGSGYNEGELSEGSKMSEIKKSSADSVAVTCESSAYYDWGAGGLLGAAYYTSLSDCNAGGTVSSNTNVGGLIGYSEASSLENCKNTADSEINAKVGAGGGLIGQAYKSKITACEGHGNIKSGYSLGGLIGEGHDITVEDCSADGTVSGSWLPGGLIGYIYKNQDGEHSSIKDCKSDTEVTGSNWKIGGLAGAASSDVTIEGCVSTGDVTSTVSNFERYEGGFIGFNEGTVKDCFALGRISYPESEDLNIGSFAGALGAGGVIENSFCDKVKNPGIHAVGGSAGEGMDDAVKDISESDVCERFYEGHIYSGEWTIDEPAACAKEGRKHIACDRCRKAIEQSIPAQGHSTKHYEAVKPTSKKAGNIEYWYCKSCKKYFSDGDFTKEITKDETIALKKQTISGEESFKKTYGEKDFSLGAKAKGKLKYKTSNEKVVVVSSSGKVTIKGTGIANITMKAAATGGYGKASKKVTITVVPKKVSSLEVKAGKEKMVVSWKKAAKASGYKIVYAKDSKFTKGKKTVIVKGSKTLETKIKKLKSNKTYYVKIRAYKLVGEKKVYGAFCEAKKVKIK